MASGPTFMTLAGRDAANAQWQVDLAVSCWKLGSFDGLPVIERRDLLKRGLNILLALRQAERLLPNQDSTGWFEAELEKLDAKTQE